MLSYTKITLLLLLGLFHAVFFPTTNISDVWTVKFFPQKKPKLVIYFQPFEANLHLWRIKRKITRTQLMSVAACQASGRLCLFT